MSLKGKVAIVTGGNSGIGRVGGRSALAKAQGANIAIDYVVGSRGRPTADSEKRGRRSWATQAIGVEADVSTDRRRAGG